MDSEPKSSLMVTFTLETLEKESLKAPANMFGTMGLRTKVNSIKDRDQEMESG